MSNGYDRLAWFYDRYWASRYHDAAAPVLDRLFYGCVPPGSRVLDVCCGTGHLIERLVARGYEVFGIDASLEMLRHARRRASAARLICADVSRFAVSAGCAGALSTFDSINHVMSDDALLAALAAVRQALAPGGLFVFDVNTRAAYVSEWDKTAAVVEDDAALFISGRYDPLSGHAESRLTLFRLDDGWQRSDVLIPQRALDPATLVTMLVDSGFTEVHAVDAADAGMLGDIAVGRAFLHARRQ